MEKTVVMSARELDNHIEAVVRSTFHNTCAFMEKQFAQREERARQQQALEEAAKDVYLNRKEAAAFLGVSPATITAWVQSGQLIPVPNTKSKRVLFSRNKLSLLRDARNKFKTLKK